MIRWYLLDYYALGPGSRKTLDNKVDFYKNFLAFYPNIFITLIFRVRKPAIIYNVITGVLSFHCVFAM